MGDLHSSAAFGGDIAITHRRRARNLGARFVTIPGVGRIMFTRDRGDARTFGREQFMSHAFAQHRDGDGKLISEYDLGSGLVTNAGVDMLANDATWIAAATPFSTLSSMKYHSTGTGATVAAAADYYLQTVGTHFSGSTNNYYTGSQSVTAPNIYVTAGTMTYSGSEAVTEWGLFMANAANFSATATGTPTSTTFPDSGAAFTTAGNGLKGWTAEIHSGAVNTPTTTVMGLVTANTGTSLTIANGWWTLANASGSTPGANQAYVIYPTMWDHKVFSAINVVASDTLTITYSLTCTSGG